MSAKGDSFRWVRFVKSIEGLSREDRQQKMMDYIKMDGVKVGTRHVDIVEIQLGLKYRTKEK